MARSAKLTLAVGTAIAIGFISLTAAPSQADSLLAWAAGGYRTSPAIDPYVRDDRRANGNNALMAGAQGNLRRQIVSYPTHEAPGTIIIDTPNTFLYLVLGNGKAMRYGIGVGREGFTWSGVEHISRMSEWPDWRPPAEMIARQPYLPRFIAGGPGNPMGARALYLGDTVYRIHGTNDPSTIGTRVSSGCIRLANGDIIDLYGRTKSGAKVVVLPMRSARTASERGSRRVY